MQEQQLKARQLVLQQQAASAVAAASKTQREVRGLVWSRCMWVGFVRVVWGVMEEGAQWMLALQLGASPPCFGDIGKNDTGQGWEVRLRRRGTAPVSCAVQVSCFIVCRA